MTTRDIENLKELLEGIPKILLWTRNWLPDVRFIIGNPRHTHLLHYHSTLIEEATCEDAQSWLQIYIKLNVYDVWMSVGGILMWCWSSGGLVV